MKTTRLSPTSSIAHPAFATFLLLLAGCGDNRPTTVPVTGTVTFRGGPMPEKGMMFFTVLEPAEGFPARPGVADFDLMVEDIEATHARLSSLGIEPSEIEPGAIHRSFTVRDPSGQVIKFNSSHNSDKPV